ncbi:hypothetical protein SEA_RASPUTIA_37 [Microbacterium phage Rasputia]|nr:hypothetical protein SEA_RASPUTIA_37 [Microbacterium phage Rasputia]
MSLGQAWVLLGTHGSWVNAEKIESVDPLRAGGSRVRMVSGHMHTDLRKPEEVLEAIRAAVQALSEAQSTPKPAASKKLEAEPFLGELKIDPTIGPHSRACGASRHVHGIGCAKDCPTCRGKSPAQRLMELRAALGTRAAAEAEKALKETGKVLDELRGEFPDTPPKERHLHAVPKPQDLEPGKEYRTGGLHPAGQSFGDPAPRSKDVLPVAPQRPLRTTRDGLCHCDGPPHEWKPGWCPVGGPVAW